MANQQMQIAETIRGMKLALRRAATRADTDGNAASDSDDSLHAHTNRGNKLNTRARFVREGRLDTTGGLAYKRNIKHAGYERRIIAKRPKLYDEDGEVVELDDIPSDDDEDAAPGVGPVEDDPFGDIRLEQLLRPLTSAAELPGHPSLSQAYTSQALSQMAADAAEMVRREKASLWKAKRLLSRFRGDGMWMSGVRFTTDQDALLLQDGDEGLDSGEQSVAMDEDIEIPLAESEDAPRQQQDGEVMNGVETQDHVEPVPAPASIEHDPNGNSSNGTAPAATTADRNIPPPSPSPSPTSSTAQPPSHAMTTRARARSPAPHEPFSPTSRNEIPSLHPWFLLPSTAPSDRDLSLPSPEAEETRKLLLLYVQKQENIVRQFETLYNGLQRTDRLRKEVWQACRAEGHMMPNPDGKGGVVTEMSDGEDWYDVRDWGLDGDGGVILEKGKDDVEDPAEEEGRRVGGRRRRVVNNVGR